MMCEFSLKSINLFYYSTYYANDQNDFKTILLELYY